MQLSETIKLKLNKEEYEAVLASMKEYVFVVNILVDAGMKGTDVSIMSSKNVPDDLPSAIRNQCIRDAISVIRAHDRKTKKTERKNEWRAAHGKKLLKIPSVPVLKKPRLYVNNQNFRIRDSRIIFPLMIDGKSKRMSFRTTMTEAQKETLSDAKTGTLRVVLKGKNIVCQVVYEKEESSIVSGNVTMGVDLGIKCPAVSYCSDGNVRFYGNGRKNKYMRRYFRKRREILQKKKQIKAVKRIGHKENRVMKDIDHKISREIVNTAIKHGVSTIKLESLENIRVSTRASRKNNRSLHSWSFFRLAMYIEYKAKLAGIAVEYVEPAYTSQKCPICGNLHHADDRKYICSCGFHSHRDIVGAMNICNSTESAGNRQTA